MSIGTWFGEGWAQPVVSRRWAFIATVADAFKRATRYRFGVHAAHRAWEKACGIQR